MNERRQINITVDEKVYQKVSKLAETARMSPTSYATLLFDAAYSARCAETGDIELDVAVGRVALLHGTRFDVVSICQATGLSEAFVNRAVAAWLSEMGRGRTPAKRRIARA